MVSSQLLVLKPLRPVYPILRLFKIYSPNTLFVLERSFYMTLSWLSGRHPELKRSSCGSSECPSVRASLSDLGLANLTPLYPPPHIPPAVAAGWLFCCSSAPAWERTQKQSEEGKFK